eukprot:11388367-Heterocapsa_arctica.AAC.2
MQAQSGRILPRILFQAFHIEKHNNDNLDQHHLDYSRVLGEMQVHHGQNIPRILFTASTLEKHINLLRSEEKRRKTIN